MAVIEKIGGKFRGAQSSDPTADVLLDLLLAFGFVLSVFASGIGLLHGHALTFASILTFARVSG
jgi:hypothetical protein